MFRVLLILSVQTTFLKDQRFVGYNMELISTRDIGTVVMDDL